MALNFFFSTLLSKKIKYCEIVVFLATFVRTCFFLEKITLLINGSVNSVHDWEKGSVSQSFLRKTFVVTVMVCVRVGHMITTLLVHISGGMKAWLIDRNPTLECDEAQVAEHMLSLIRNDRPRGGKEYWTENSLVQVQKAGQRPLEGVESILCPY